MFKSAEKMNSEEGLLYHVVIDRLKALDHGDSKAFFEGLVNEYLIAGPAYIDRLVKSVSNGNLDDAKKCVHQFSAGSATIGAMAVKKICRDLEKHAKIDQKTSQLVQELQTVWPKVVTALKSIKK